MLWLDSLYRLPVTCAVGLPETAQVFGVEPTSMVLITLQPLKGYIRVSAVDMV